jgi:hypothetical protein
MKDENEREGDHEGTDYYRSRALVGKYCNMLSI